MKKPGNKNKAHQKAPIKKNYNNIKEYKVTKECELLEFLLETFKTQSRNSVKSLLSSHRVSIDGAPVSQFNFKLYPEDTIIISNSPIKKKTRSKLPIIYEDDDIIVINKPSGLLSIASDNEKSSTAYRMLSDYVQQKDKHNRVFVVHRLDEDTSGVFMIAKNVKIQQALQDKWNDLVKKRGYFAIVEGVIKDRRFFSLGLREFPFRRRQGVRDQISDRKEISAAGEDPTGIAQTDHGKRGVWNMNGILLLSRLKSGFGNVIADAQIH